MYMYIYINICIQGKFLGMKQAGIQEVGVQWTAQHYQRGGQVCVVRMHVCACVWVSVY